MLAFRELLVTPYYSSRVCGKVVLTTFQIKLQSTKSNKAPLDNLKLWFSLCCLILEWLTTLIECF